MDSLTSEQLASITGGGDITPEDLEQAQAKLKTPHGKLLQGVSIGRAEPGHLPPYLLHDGTVVRYGPMRGGMVEWYQNGNINGPTRPRVYNVR